MAGTGKHQGIEVIRDLRIINRADWPNTCYHDGLGVISSLSGSLEPIWRSDSHRIPVQP